MTLTKAVLSLMGLSIGDGFGQILYAPEATNSIQKRLLPPGPWFWTDDTHMAISVVEELKVRGWIDQDYLARRMSWRFMTDLRRGYGIGTRQTLERISNGEYFRNVANLVPGGSFGSAGAARAVPLGGFYEGFPGKAAREARLVSAITHLHPESLAGAEAVAAAACLAVMGNTHSNGSSFLKEVAKFVSESQVKENIIHAVTIPSDDMEQAVHMFRRDESPTVMSVVPFALWCAAHHMGRFEDALWWAASGLNPRDTVCAIVGGIVALSCQSIPTEWVKRCEPLPNSLSVEFQDKEIQQQQPIIRNDIDKKLQSTENVPSVSMDSLTGIPNLFALLKWSDNLNKSEVQSPFSLIAIQLITLWDINISAGRTAGDELLRDTAQLLSSLSSSPVYRTGGDKFIVVVNNSSIAISLAQNLAQAVHNPHLRTNRVAVIHFNGSKEETDPGHVLACLYTCLTDRFFQDNDGSPRELSALDIRSMADYPWVARDLADQIMNMGKAVTESMKLAQTDSISQLPNMRAAMQALETLMDHARRSEKPLALLLIDGDNLRKYNEISYEAGDKAIWLLGNTMKGLLRETDFIARWRTGDEFLVLLPNTNSEEAVQIGQRLCAEVKQASRDWLFRSSISMGIALFPDNGPTIQDLLHAAEQGLDEAKSSGKNRAVLVRPSKEILDGE
jgi:diguanylate cyclase (GGDEF)-like protein